MAQAKETNRPANPPTKRTPEQYAARNDTKLGISAEVMAEMERAKAAKDT